MIDLAAKRGLKTLAILHEDTLFPRAIAQGTLELAKARGLRILVTAKDLTAEDNRRLNGGVDRVLQKNALTPDEILREVSATLARCLERERVRRMAGVQR